MVGGNGASVDIDFFNNGRFDSVGWGRWKDCMILCIQPQNDPKT